VDQSGNGMTEDELTSIIAAVEDCLKLARRSHHVALAEAFETALVEANSLRSAVGTKASKPVLAALPPSRPRRQNY
jgi:hypothetical protein